MGNVGRRCANSVCVQVYVRACVCGLTVQLAARTALPRLQNVDYLYSAFLIRPERCI